MLKQSQMTSFEFKHLIYFKITISLKILACRMVMNVIGVLWNYGNHIFILYGLQLFVPNLCQNLTAADDLEKNRQNQ